MTIPEQQLIDEVTPTAVFTNGMILGELRFKFRWGDQVMEMEKWRPKIASTSFVDDNYPDPVKDNIEIKDAFIQSDVIENEDKRVRDIISQITNMNVLPKLNIIAKRLSTLYQYAKEEEEDLPGINVDSLQGFLDFITVHTFLKRPNLSLTPNNEIHAVWKGKANNRFSIHFLDRRKIHYVISKVNSKHPDQLTYHSGSLTSDVVLDEVNAWKSIEWIFE